MLVGIIITVFMGLGVLLMSLNASEIAPAVIQPLMQPLLLVVDKLFYFLAALLPILAAIIPLYVLKNRDEEALVLGAVYGTGLMIVVLVMGLDTHIQQLFRTTWYGGVIGTTTATLGPVAEALGSLAYGVCLWIWGAALAILDMALAGVIGVSRATMKGGELARSKVKSGRKSWLEKLTERIKE